MSFWKRLFGQSSKDQQPVELPAYRFELIPVRGRDALEQLEQLRRERGADGPWPIIIGEAEDIGFHQEMAEFDGYDPAAAIESAGSLDPVEFFTKRPETDPEYYVFPEGEKPAESIDPEGITAHLNVLTRRPKKQVFLCRVPAQHNFEIPAYLPFGGWNECPMPAEQVAIWRRWQERYGAEIVCATRDVLQAVVARPPTSWEDALELAREQYVYCPDIVDQGVETIQNLAALLNGGKTWYFWWD